MSKPLCTRRSAYDAGRLRLARQRERSDWATLHRRPRVLSVSASLRHHLLVLIRFVLANSPPSIGTSPRRPRPRHGGPNAAAASTLVKGGPPLMSLAKVPRAAPAGPAAQSRCLGESVPLLRHATRASSSSSPPVRPRARLAFSFF